MAPSRKIRGVVALTRGDGADLQPGGPNRRRWRRSTAGLHHRGTDRGEVASVLGGTRESRAG